MGERPDLSADQREDFDKLDPGVREQRYDRLGVEDALVIDNNHIFSGSKSVLCARTLFVCCAWCQGLRIPSADQHFRGQVLTT